MTFLIIVSIITQFIIILTNLIGLPGNILAGLIPLIWFFTGHLYLTQLIIIILIILTGEFIEFLLSVILGRYAGISNKSLMLSIIGALILGIIMTPLFFGLGAVVGSFTGAFLGVFLYEIIKEKNLFKALKSGLIVFKSRILGTVIKFSLGLFMTFLTAYFLI